MPIFFTESYPEHVYTVQKQNISHRQLPAVNIVRDCGGTMVHYAMDPNKREYQDDRLSVSELNPKLLPEEVTGMVVNLTNRIFEKWSGFSGPRPLGKMIDDPKAPAWTHYSGGATLLIAAWDSRNSGNISLQSIGDSVAALVAHDAKGKKELFTLTADLQNWPNIGLLRNIGGTKEREKDHDIKPLGPRFSLDSKANIMRDQDAMNHMQIIGEKRAYDHSIDIGKVRNALAKKGFDPKTLTLDLVIASDAIKALTKEEIAGIVSGDSQNKAQTLTERIKAKKNAPEEDIRGSAKDNVSIAVIPMDFQAKQPIIACVSDGIGGTGLGYFVADQAIRQFDSVMKRQLALSAPGPGQPRPR